MIDKQSVVQATFLGAAVGDALGVPYEFLTREEARKAFCPDMVGSDTHASFSSRWVNIVPAGSYSDDTAMILSTASAFVENGGVINYRAVMDNFLSWWEKGDYSSLDYSFGLGNTVSMALMRYKTGKEPLESGGKNVSDNGNGALMRILPFSLYAILRSLPRHDYIELVSNGSRLTHAHEISMMGCCIFTDYLKICLECGNCEEAMAQIQAEDYSLYFTQEAINAYEWVLRRPWQSWQEDDISESGYCVETLKAALYCIMRNRSFEGCVSEAVRLGGDADTNACVAGALAGALYGTEGIPERWLKKLRKKAIVSDLANLFALFV